MAHRDLERAGGLVSDASRRAQRIEHGSQRVRAAFPNYHISVSLNHSTDGRDHWYVAVEVANNKWTSASGDDLDAVLESLGQQLRRTG